MKSSFSNWAVVVCQIKIFETVLSGSDFISDILRPPEFSRKKHPDFEPKTPENLFVSVGNP